MIMVRVAVMKSIVNMYHVIAVNMINLQLATTVKGVLLLCPSCTKHLHNQPCLACSSIHVPVQIRYQTWHHLHLWIEKLKNWPTIANLLIKFVWSISWFSLPSSSSSSLLCSCSSQQACSLLVSWPLLACSLYMSNCASMLWSSPSCHVWTDIHVFNLTLLLILTLADSFALCSQHLRLHSQLSLIIWACTVKGCYNMHVQSKACVSSVRMTGHPMRMEGHMDRQTSTE